MTGIITAGSFFMEIPCSQHSAGKTNRSGFRPRSRVRKTNAVNILTDEGR